MILQCLLTFIDFVEMTPDPSNQLSDRLIPASCDTSLFEDLLTKFGIADAKRELLFLGGLSFGQFAGEEVFQKRGYFHL